jgi:hypothetical protein
MSVFVEEGWRQGAVVMTIAFIGIALFRFDLVMSVSYRPVRVVHVQVVQGGQAPLRLVTVEMGNGRRNLLTGDPFIATPAGALVCLGETRMLLRSWTRYSLQHSAYCPGIRLPKYPTPDMMTEPTVRSSGG